MLTGSWLNRLATQNTSVLQIGPNHGVRLKPHCMAGG